MGLGFYGTKWLTVRPFQASCASSVCSLVRNFTCHFLTGASFCQETLLFTSSEFLILGSRNQASLGILQHNSSMIPFLYPPLTIFAGRVLLKLFFPSLGGSSCYNHAFGSDFKLSYSAPISLGNPWSPLLPCVLFSPQIQAVQHSWQQRGAAKQFLLISVWGAFVTTTRKTYKWTKTSGLERRGRLG